MKKFNFSHQAIHQELPAAANAYLHALANINTNTNRYQVECALLEICGAELRAFFPARPCDHPQLWVSHVYDQVYLDISRHNQLAIKLACELLALDPHLPFGKTIKCRLARALKRVANDLSLLQQQQIIRATLKLLALPYPPRELKFYVRILSKFPASSYLEALNQVHAASPLAQHLKAYLQNAARTA